MIPALINLIFYLLILALLVALVFWVLTQIPLPAPLGQIIRVALVVIVVLVIILLLLQVMGSSGGLSLPKVVQ